MTDSHTVRLELRPSSNSRDYVVVYSVDGGPAARLRRETISPTGFSTLNDAILQYLRPAAKLAEKMQDQDGRIGPMSYEKVKDIFFALAMQTYDAYLLIFKEDGRDPLKEIIEKFPPASSITLILSSGETNLNLPWEFMVDTCPDAATFSFEMFWGIKYTLYRQIVFEKLPRPAPQLVNANPVKFGLIIDRDLPNAAFEEKSFSQLFTKENILPLDCELDSARKYDLLKHEIKIYLGKQMHFLHFACHTDKPNMGRRDSLADAYCFMLTRYFSLCPADIRRTEIIFEHTPLVFLNACSTDENAEKDYYHHWSSVREFLQRGAPAVITTQCDIHDGFAARFAGPFYSELLVTADVGEALMKCRRHFIDDPYHNPLGLLYGLYASNPPFHLSINAQHTESQYA